MGKVLSTRFGVNQYINTYRRPDEACADRAAHLPDVGALRAA